MCGIIGSINVPFDNKTLDLLEHRGPDSKGIETFEVNSDTIKLGHTRLAIVELSEAGHQPMVSECGKYIITFNGEIYNHELLREKLDHECFVGHSDTETILYYLIENGIEGVRDFNGIFAFSFLDLVNKRQYVVRDHFGVKPVYYSYNSDNLLFASEIRPLDDLTESGWSKKNLSTLLRLRYLPSPLTLQKNVKKLRPGHFLDIDLAEENLLVEEKPFIKKSQNKKKRTDANTLSKYGNYIESAINRQLMADVEVGILLSGGIDSAVVAAIAQENVPYKLKAFTIGFEGNHNEDEINQAKETADLLGLDHIVRKIDFDDFLSMLDKTTKVIEEPLATTSVIPMYYLAELASNDVKVVLTGQGADEPLGGYGRYQGEIIASNLPNSFFRGGQALVNLLPIKNEKALRAFKSLGENHDLKRFLKVYTVFSQQEIEDLIGVSESQSLKLIEYYYRILGCGSKKSSAEKMMAIDTRMNLSDDLLLYTDKITMNFGLECRVPMLDHKLLQFIESLPVNNRVKWRKRKIVHKKYASNLLPPKIINRKKLGFESPTKTWFKNYSSRIRDLLLSNTIFSDIFDSKTVERILDQHQQGYNKEKQIFLLLSVYFWMNNNLN